MQLACLLRLLFILTQLILNATDIVSKIHVKIVIENIDMIKNIMIFKY